MRKTYIKTVKNNPTVKSHANFKLDEMLCIKTSVCKKDELFKIWMFDKKSYQPVQRVLLVERKNMPSGKRRKTKKKVKNLCFDSKEVVWKF